MQLGRQRNAPMTSRNKPALGSKIHNSVRIPKEVSKIGHSHVEQPEPISKDLCGFKDHRVESRTGAVTVVSRWLVDLAFAAPPQSGLAWFCFLFPLIEPDRRVSRNRLSEKVHEVAHGKLRVRWVSRARPNVSCMEASGNCLIAAPCLLCLAHSHCRSRLRA
jgi:hypothetical protein